MCRFGLYLVSGL